MALFADWFALLLGPTEQVNFTLTRNPDGALTVVVTPLLKDAPDALPDALAPVRAALARPVRIVAPAAELDARLPDLLRRYAASRATLAESWGALESLEEAARLARAVAHRAKTAPPSQRPPVAEPDGEGTVPAGTGSPYCWRGPAPRAGSRKPIWRRRWTIPARTGRCTACWREGWTRCALGCGRKRRAFRRRDSRLRTITPG